MDFSYKLSGGSSALYLNFPFCKIPCSYCHYIDNIKFGYDSIPEDYMNMIYDQLDRFGANNKGIVLDSIYFGGGTPSLLNDNQIETIHEILNKYKIESEEISIEIHPGACNFDYLSNDFFTRYSFGVQSFESKKRCEYRRFGYETEDIAIIVNKLRNSKIPRNINIDILFYDKISDVETDTINQIRPDTVTFYPNTKGRGNKRLTDVLSTLKKIDTNLDGYNRLAKSKFIFIKNGCQQSRYSKLEYEKIGDILGLGHNSLSFVGDVSFLCLYQDGNIVYKERTHCPNRIKNAVISSIVTGIPYQRVIELFPKVLLDHMFYSVNENMDIMEKHWNGNRQQLIYLPDTEYIKFYEILQKEYKEFCETFLGTIGFGDGDYNVIKHAYNQFLNNTQLKSLGADEDLEKIKTPDMLILVEGIDGSGKDTFVRHFVDALKQRFYYSENSRISVLGQPDSRCEDGCAAKTFIEDIVYDGSSEDVKSILKNNRIDSEKKIDAMPGIRILIRGFVTDKATYSKVFSKEENLGEGTIIKNWDRYIVVDVDPRIADERIEKRGIPRTWRENIEHLRYFRNYYKCFESELFDDKTVIENTSLEKLQLTAIEMADKIYADELRKRE